MMRGSTVGIRLAPVALLATALVFALTSSGLAVPVTDGMVLWLDATDTSTLFQDSSLTTPALDGDPVGGWKDKSGNDNDAVQDDVFVQPVRNDTALNGMPAVRFDGVDGDGMFIDEGLFLERPYTAFIVNQYYGDIRGRTLQGRDANWLHGLWAGNVASYAEGWVSNNRTAEQDFAYVEDTTGTPDGDSTFFVNGVDFTLDSTPVGSPGTLGLGSVGAFPAEVSDADVSEIVIYDRVLSQDELTQVRDSLYTKYNVTMLEPPDMGAETNTVLSGTLGTFAGGDPGEGLDVEGNFIYAINVGGPGDLTVGDAQFTDGSEAGMADGTSPGASITDANEILEWAAADYGNSADSIDLATVMHSIRWNTPPGLDVDLDVDPGQAYKLQLLFAEGCCDRGFDIAVEDQLLVDNFNVQAAQGGINNASEGVVFTDEVSAADGVLTISLGGENPRAPDNNPILNGLTLEVVEGLLQPGDADQNGQFDQLDLVKVQIAAKYLTGQAATWGEGDWDGAPSAGGIPGDPPTGDGLFDQIDIIAALNAGLYLTGPYLALQRNGQEGDGQTSIIYDAGTGELKVDAPAGVELTSVNIDSAAGIFTGDAAQNLGGSFDNDADNNIFKATFGSSFGSLSFGNVAQSGLSEEFLAGDLSVVGSLQGGGDLGPVDLIYVPEPAAFVLVLLGALGVAVGGRWRKGR